MYPVLVYFVQSWTMILNNLVCLEDDSDDKRYHNLYSDTSCCATDITFDEYITREEVNS